MSVYTNNRGKLIIDIDDFFHPDGSKEPRIRKTANVQRQRDAEKEELNIRRELADGTYGKRVSDNDIPTVAEFKDSFMEVYRGERRKASGVEDKESIFRAHIIPLFGGKKVTAFDIVDQRKLRARFADSKSSSRYNCAVAAMNRLIRLYHEENKLKGSPFKFKLLKPTSKKKPFYGFEQCAELRDAAKAHSTTGEVAVLLGVDAGLRRGEMFALTPAHCNMRLRQIDVEQSEVIVKGKRCMDQTKGLKVRTVDMTNRLHAALERHFAANKGAKRVLLTPEGKPFTNEQFRDHLLAPIQDAAGLTPNGHVHIQRHTFCSHLAIRGVPIMTIKELAGHQNINTTLGYMHLAPGDKRRAIAKLEEEPPAC